MIDLTGGLEENQTAVRVGTVDAPAQALAGQGKVILFGIVTEQGKAKPASPLEGAMTGAAVAAHAPEEAHEVALEVDLWRRFLSRCLAGVGGPGWGGRSQK